LNKSTWAWSAALLGSIAITPTFAADPGQALYQAHCSVCHGESGKGAPGTEDFAGKGGALSNPDAVVFERIAQGYQSPGSPMPMPAMGGKGGLTDQQIKEVIGYLRQKFGA
jgi:mono/diheme cytochrome c family protein